MQGQNKKLQVVITTTQVLNPSALEATHGQKPEKFLSTCAIGTRVLLFVFDICAEVGNLLCKPLEGKHMVFPRRDGLPLIPSRVPEELREVLIRDGTEHFLHVLQSG